jgi:hypothetical protein
VLPGAGGNGAVIGQGRVGVEVACVGIGVQRGLGAGVCRAGMEGGQLAGRGDWVVVGNVGLYWCADGDAFGHGGGRAKPSCNAGAEP